MLESAGPSHLATLLTIIAAYIALNSSLNLTNRWALGVYGFRFPFVLTSAHMCFCFLALLPYHLAHDWEVHKAKLRQQWRGLAAIGAFLACGISLNNISLVFMTLSLNQVIRSSIPVVACVLSVLVQGKRPTRLEAGSLVVLSLGVMIALWGGTVAGQPIGVVFCMLGTLSSGAMVTFSSKLLSEKLNVLSLAFYTAPVSLLCLLPFVVVYELQHFSVYAAAHGSSVTLIILVSSVNALAYNIMHYLMIQKTSAVATTVVGEVKIVGLMILSALLLGEGRQFTGKMTVGCSLALVGFCFYSHTKVIAFRRQQQLQQQQQQQQMYASDVEAAWRKLPAKSAPVAEVPPSSTAKQDAKQAWHKALVGGGGDIKALVPLLGEGQTGYWAGTIQASR
ncbi:hypothetical protein N2152v2_008740 [Parachlorella kessleri]